MAKLSKGWVFGVGDEVTDGKLNALVDDATISGIVDADVDAGAAIAFSKIAQSNIDGSLLTGLPNIVSGAGVIPAANLTSVAQKGANSDITSLAGLTTLLSRAQGGLASDVANNAASGVVFLNASSQLPAVDGSLLTGLSTVTQVNDTDGGTQYRYVDGEVATALSVAKTITSGKTVLLIATGYITGGDAATTSTIKLKNGSNISQTVNTFTTANYSVSWSCSAIVTGLSGSVTFSVTVQAVAGNSHMFYGNLEVLEF